MRILITYSRDRTTIIASPLPKQERLPPIRKLEIENGQTYAVPFGLFPEKICLGAIPPDYKMISADKYQITFKNNRQPRARRQKPQQNVSSI